MAKEVKTNAMRILDRNKINYEINLYECDEFIDGVHIADKLHQDYDMSFKTLVMQGKSGQFFVFALPIDKEVDMKKAAKVVGEKSLSMVHVKDINKVTGYMKKQYPTVIHESAKNFDQIIVSGGRLGAQIFLAPDDLVKVTKGQYADIISE